MEFSEQKREVIRLEKVCKTYKTAHGDFPALRDVSLSVNQGEFLAITGKSGAGKTTLVNMIIGADQLTSGDVIVGDVSVHRMNEDRQARWRGRTIGVVFQSFFLIPNISLLDNVLLPMDFCGLYRKRESRERGMQLLREVELGEHAEKLPSQISGGQQQRVAIARALANDPPLIVADEPTGRLDSLTADIILDIFSRLTRRGKTIVMVTHDLSSPARYDRVLTLTDGELRNGD